MDQLIMLIFAGWLVINGYVIYKGFVFMRLVGQQQPDLDNARLSGWIRGAEMPDDVPVALRDALRELRQWRAIGRRYFFACVVAILGLVGLEVMRGS